MSRRVRAATKSTLLSKPATSSSNVNCPDASVSNASHTASKAFFDSSSSRSLASALRSSLFSRAEVAASTITASTRLTRHKEIAENTERNNMDDNGCSSIIGIVIWPQLSPATICCMKVKFEDMTDEKALPHRSQSPKPPRSATRTLMGCRSSTATIENKVTMMKSITDAQSMAVIALIMQATMSSNSLNKRSTRINRTSRKSRKIRKKAKDGRSLEAALKAFESRSEATTNMSNNVQLEENTFLRKQ
mmetsp:Transcript_127898/g.368431  ORF Transcript_127898/g.368431 Transcript_127898/m.368431 type:complete len:248 (-) Transcript_127898:337-1080(-)